MVELRWDGKVDKNGKRVAPLKVALPFQTIETVNESAQQRQRTLELFASGRQSDWRNRLIWGDKKYVLPSLLPEFAGKVDLIYIDPPFATGQDFSFQARVGDDTFEKEASIIEQKAYRDTWGNRPDSFVAWLYDTVVFLNQLLSEKGSIFVHLDQKMSHYGKLVMDEVFSSANFQNEIVWKRYAAHSLAHEGFDNVAEIVLFYTRRSADATFNRVFGIADEATLAKRFPHVEEETGKRFQHIALEQSSNRSSAGEVRSIQGREVISDIGWRWSQETFDKRISENPHLIYWTRGGRPRYKKYADDYQGAPLGNIWTDIGYLSAGDSERVNYPTQKPEALLDRIIRASSNEGDLVLDCFCGSGTTAAVAEKLNRRWIACDLGRFAIHTTRKRLLGIEDLRPFVVQNLGKYERQVWQRAEFGEEAAHKTRSYRKFILDLYHAEMVEGYAWLHGVKRGRMVHVGSVDSPVAVGDVRQTALEFHQAIGTGKHAPTRAGIDVLGWDFALNMNETAQDILQQASLDVRFLRIPREVLEQKAVDQGDIRFFELAALSVAHQCARRELSIELTDFMIPPDDVPDDVAKAVRHWSDWIDYWAVDFDYRDDTFHNQWQSYRTRQDRTLLLRANHKYRQPGEYVVLVKAIDILGNDTTKTLRVQVV